MGHQPPLRALNFGDVLDQTIALIRDNFRAWLKVSSVAYLPIVVLQMVQLAMAGPSMFDFSRLSQGEPSPDFGPTVIFWVVSTVVLGIVSGFGFLLLSAALTHGLAQRFLGQPVSASGSYRAALGSLWRLILCSIVAVLLFLLMMVVGAVPVGTVALLRLPEWAIVAAGIVGFLAIMVLSIFFSIRWTLALPALVASRHVHVHVASNSLLQTNSFSTVTFGELARVWIFRYGIRDVRRRSGTSQEQIRPIHKSKLLMRQALASDGSGGPRNLASAWTPASTWFWTRNFHRGTLQHSET